MTPFTEHQSHGVSLSVFCYVGASTTSSLCARYQRAASGCTTKELVEWKGALRNDRLTRCLLLLEGKRRQRLSVTAHLFFFYSLLCFCFLCYVSSLLWLPSSWALQGKCAIPVRWTATKKFNSSIGSSWSKFKNAVLDSCWQILVLFTFELRHDSVVDGKGGKNHCRQWGVSLTVRKTDRRREDWAGWVHLHPVVWLMSSRCSLSQQKSGIFWRRGGSLCRQRWQRQMSCTVLDKKPFIRAFL